MKFKELDHTELQKDEDELRLVQQITEIENLMDLLGKTATKLVKDRQRLLEQLICLNSVEPAIDIPVDPLM